MIGVQGKKLKSAAAKARAAIDEHGLSAEMPAAGFFGKGRLVEGTPGEGLRSAAMVGSGSTLRRDR